MDVTTGYSVEWRVKLDASVPTNPSAAGMLAGNPATYAFMRMYNHVGIPGSGVPGKITAEIQSPGGNASRMIGADPTAWQTYRMDVQGGTGKLYLNNYPAPIVTQAGLGAAPAHAIWWGDGTGGDNGKYKVDHVRSWQSGVVGAPAAPGVNDPTHTRFLAHYNGNTPNSGMDADYAVGSKTAVGTGGVVGPPAKFGAGSLDSYNASGTVTYNTAGNFNKSAATVEMWVKPTNWSDGAYAGFFDVYEPGVGDIRLQKTNGGNLQAYMYDAVAGKSWSLTSTTPLSLTDDWHHLAWSWDFDANMAALYVDGQVVANVASLSGLSTIDYPGILPSAFEVGSIQNGSSPLYGLIDEFRISGADLYYGQNFTPLNAPFVPEPATIALVAVGLAIMGRRRRR